MSASSHRRSINTGTLRLAWDGVRLPCLYLLTLFSPVVETLGVTLMLLGLLVSIAYRISSAGTAFPFWLMIGISLGFGIFVILYHALIGFLSR